VPRRPLKGVDAAHVFEFRDSGSAVVATFCVALIPREEAYIVITCAELGTFTVKYERLPTIGKLFSYKRFHDELRILRAAPPKWDDHDWRFSIAYRLGVIRTLRPDLSLPEPKNRLDFEGILNVLGGVSIKELDLFVGSLDPR